MIMHEWRVRPEMVDAYLEMDSMSSTLQKLACSLIISTPYPGDEHLNENLRRADHFCFM